MLVRMRSGCGCKHGRGCGAALDSEAIADAGEPVLLEIVPEHRRHAIEIAILPDLRVKRRRIDPRLIRIDFPDVEVHHERRVHGALPVAHRALHQREGELAEVVGAGDRNVVSHHVGRRDRNLEDRLLAVVMLMDESPPGLVHVLAKERTHARVELVAFLGQDIERPQVIGRSQRCATR